MNVKKFAEGLANLWVDRTWMRERLLRETFRKYVTPAKPRKSKKATQ